MINLLIINGTLHIGGAEHVISNMVHSFDMSKLNIYVCHLKEGGVVSQELSEQGFKVVAPPKKVKMNYLSALNLRALVKELKIDVMHTHDLGSFFDASLCRLLTPSVKHIHTFHFGNYPHRPKKYLLMEKLFWRVPDQLVAVGNAQKKAIQSTFNIPDSKIMTIWNGITKPQSDLLAELKTKQNSGKIIILFNNF